MRFIRTKAAVAGIGLALSLAACGDAGDDIITGKKGNDIIIGGGDDDQMRGDSGKDTLQGKGGDDKCLFNSEDKISSCDKADEVRIPDFPF